MSRKKTMQKVILISLAILLICCIVAGILYIYPVLPSPEGVWEPNWSSDGNLIAFRCVFVSTNNLKSYRLGDNNDIHFWFYDWSDICVADQNGKQFRRLTSGGNFSDFSWSPNGKLLAWSHENNFVWDTISIWDSQEHTYTEFLLPEKIDYLYNLKWSEDGKQLYLGGTGAIFDILSNQLLLLPKQEIEGESFYGFARSYDGEYLALDRYMDFLHGQPDLIISKDNKPVFVGYEFDGRGVYSWSSNKNILAWTGSPIPKDLQDPEKDYYDTVLFLTYAPTGETIRYEADNGLFTCCDDVFWSEDGMNLALLATDYIEILEFSKSDSGFPLLIAKHSRLDVHKLESYNYYKVDGGLSWSPDGKYILVGSNYQLWFINIQDNLTQKFSIDFPWTSLVKQ